MEIKIIGSQQVYVAWYHELEKEFNDIKDSECEDRFIYECATCSKLEPLYLIKNK